MKSIVAVFALSGALVAGAAFAQTSSATPPAKSPGVSSSSMAEPLTSAQMKTVKDYAMKHKHASMKIDESVKVGSTLPSSVEFYAVEGAPTVSKYKYTIVNDKTVLVDPSTRKVVEIIE
jgi:Protein of unknown function (DUF1236)